MAHRSVTAPGGYTVHTTTLGEMNAADFQRWRALDARALEPTPYLSADYLEPANPHWPAAQAVRFLIVSHGSEMRMLMPFRIMPLHPRVPVPVLST